MRETKSEHLKEHSTCAVSGCRNEATIVMVTEQVQTEMCLDCVLNVESTGA
jgi:hypothetical protein